MTVIDQIVPAVSFGADMLTQLGELDGSGDFIFVFPLLEVCGLFVCLRGPNGWVTSDIPGNLMSLYCQLSLIWGI